MKIDLSQFGQNSLMDNTTKKQITQNNNNTADQKTKNTAVAEIELNKIPTPGPEMDFQQSHRETQRSLIPADNRA